MCQDGRLLVNSVRSGKAFNVTNVGATYTWIFLDFQSTNNVFFKCKMLA